MSAISQTKSVRPMITAIFGLFLLFNVLLLVVALLAAFKGVTVKLLPEDTGLGVRLLIFAVGFAVSSALGRWLYMRLIDGEITVQEAGTAALVMLFYLVLIFAGLAFLGGFSWIWQAVFLLILLLMTFLGLTRIMGILASIIIIVLCLLAGAALFFIMS